VQHAGARDGDLHALLQLPLAVKHAQVDVGASREAVAEREELVGLPVNLRVSRDVVAQLASELVMAEALDLIHLVRGPLPQAHVERVVLLDEGAQPLAEVEEGCVR